MAARSFVDGSQVLGESGFIHADVRGSVFGKTAIDAPATMSKEAAYGAWGEPVEASQMSRPRHQFADFEPDGATGYYYMGARVYDPSLRRWLSPDPLLFAVPSLDELDANQLNLFQYARNNPITFTDRAGEFVDVVMNVETNEVEITIPVVYNTQLAGLDNATKQKFEAQIEAAWSGKFGKYEVKTNVKEASIGDILTGDYNEIKVLDASRVKSNGVDAFGKVSGCDTMYLPKGVVDENPKTAPHEAGHLMGLPDRYDTEAAKTEPEWKDHIMSNTKNGMTVDGGDIARVLEDTENNDVEYEGSLPDKKEEERKTK